MMHLGPDTGTEKKPCRTCTDFKTWAKQQQSIYKSKSDVSQRNAFGICECALILIFIEGK